MLKLCRQISNTAILPACQYGNKHNTAVTVIDVSCRYNVLPHELAAGTALICITLVTVQKVRKTLLRYSESTCQQCSSRQGKKDQSPAACTAIQQKMLPKVNSEDHVVSPGYMQLQARHQPKALVLSKAAASRCRQKPGPRWKFLRQTGCHLQQVQAHAQKASCNQEQATSLLYSSICHTAA